MKLLQTLMVAMMLVACNNTPSNANVSSVPKYKVFDKVQITFTSENAFFGTRCESTGTLIDLVTPRAFVRMDIKYLTKIVCNNGDWNVTYNIWVREKDVVKLAD